MIDAVRPLPLAAVSAIVLAAWALVSCRTAGFKQVFMALDEKGDRKRTTFFADTTAIFCAGELVSGRADVTVNSSIQAKTLYDPVSDSLIPAQGIGWIGESAPGKTTDTVVSFKLLKGTSAMGSVNEDELPYPVGTYRCDLSIDGELEESVDFAILFPDCPVLPPTAGEPCAGWVRPGAECGGFFGDTCACDPSGTWACR
jgi:hypothetical protein